MSAAVSLQLEEWLASATLEELLTGRHFFALESASPLQRALCRAVDGLALGALGEDAAVRAAFGGTLPAVCARQREVTCVSGVRVGKSLLAAALAIRWSQVVDLSALGPGETPRISILSLDKDKAAVVLNHLVGRINASPLLRLLVVRRGVRRARHEGDPAESDTDDLLLRHPSGRPVGVKVVAGKAAGAATVSRWSAGVVFDEFTRMSGAEDGVVNWDETRAAVRERLVPGAQILNIGSPWAPWGPAFDQVTAHHGRPSPRIVVVKAPAWVMNPAHWTPERVEAAKDDPDTYRTDVAAEFATPDTSFFPVDQVEQATRAEPVALAFNPQATYAAFIDPASRANAFTLVVVTRDGRAMRVAAAHEWVGSRHEPLNTERVLRSVAHVCRSYGVTSALTDQYMGDALIAQGRALRTDDGKPMPLALTMLTLDEAQKLERALCFRTKLMAGEIDLCPVTTWRRGETLTTRTLTLDVKRVRRVTTRTTVGVDLPLTTDGRHCDFWPPIMMAMGAYLADVRPPPPSDAEREAQRMREEAERRFSPRRREEGWR